MALYFLLYKFVTTTAPAFVVIEMLLDVQKLAKSGVIFWMSLMVFTKEEIH